MEESEHGRSGSQASQSPTRLHLQRAWNGFQTPHQKKVDRCQSCNHKLQAFCEHPYFEAFIFFLVFCNSVTLALDSPDAGETLVEVLEILEFTFLACFTAEMLLKIMAFKKNYFKGAWNWLDFIIVLLGWATSFSVGLNLSALRVFRAFRVFRVLKGVGKIEGLKILINSLVSSLPQLGNAFSVLAFLIVIFSVVGVQLFQGVPSRRCYMPTNGTYWTLDPSHPQRCNPSYDGTMWALSGRACAVGTTCWEPLTFPPLGCTHSEIDCVYHEPMFSWDNSLHSIMMTIKILSLVSICHCQHI